jgi:hypothetical protein
MILTGQSVVEKMGIVASMAYGNIPGKRKKDQ